MHTLSCPPPAGSSRSWGSYSSGCGPSASFRPGHQRPGGILHPLEGKRVQGYGDTGIGDIVQRVADRAGIGRKIGNHTLRRTGARLAHFAGVPLVEIMAGLGHASEKETIKYLGLTVLELGKAQRKVYDYLEIIRAKMELRDGEAVIVNKNSEKREMRVSR
mgnify:CR=1 FL=1